MSAVTASSRSSWTALGNLGGRFRDGIATTGNLVVLGVDASVAAVTDILARRFSWQEFLLQA